MHAQESGCNALFLCLFTFCVMFQLFLFIYGVCVCHKMLRRILTFHFNTAMNHVFFHHSTHCSAICVSFSFFDGGGFAISIVRSFNPSFVHFLRCYFKHTFFYSVYSITFMKLVCTCVCCTFHWIFLNFIIQPTIYLMNEPTKSVQINRSTYMIIFSRYQLLNHRILYFMYTSLFHSCRASFFFLVLLLMITMYTPFLLEVIFCNTN